MERWLAQRFERSGPRYVLASVAVAIGTVLFIGSPVMTIFPAHYEGLSLGRYFADVALADGLVLIAVAGSAIIARNGLRAVLAWSHEPSSPSSPTVRAWTFEGPRRAVLACVAVGGPLIPLFVIRLAPPHRHLGAVDWLELTIGSLGALVLISLNAWFTLELLLSPLRARLSFSRDERCRPTSLLSRVALIVPANVWLGAVGVGYLLTTRAKAGEGHLMLVYALATAATAMSVGALAPLFTTGVLHPVRKLTGAARAVALGRFDTRVAVTTTDELGELAHSFNHMLDELQESRSRIVAAADASRRTVERDLHDGAQQRLVLLALKAGMLEREQGESSLVTEIRDDIALALAELRDLAHGLYPEVLESDGLPGALKEAANNAAIPTTVDCDGAGRYRPELEAAVYFCCVEALQNAAKHAGEGARATVKLAQRADVLRFAVADDGHGFDPASDGASTGLQNMADRIGALGGTLTIDAAHGKGTRVTGELPLGGSG